MIRDIPRNISDHDYHRRYKKEMGHKYGRKFRSFVKALNYNIGRTLQEELPVDNGGNE